MYILFAVVAFLLIAALLLTCTRPIVYLFPIKPRGPFLRWLMWPLMFLEVLRLHPANGLRYAGTWATFGARFQAAKMRAGMLAMVALALAACTPGTTASVGNALDSVRLFCAVKDSVVALSAVSGSTVAPVIARGATSAYVAAACAVAGGVAVSPPARPGDAPVLVIPAAAIPLRS